jgi:type VI secretion system protein ImpJ
MATHVHWHEGLFLQPHHFQLLQREGAEQVRMERKLGWHYPYGVIEARLLADELEDGRIRFEKLRVIMPSGLEINHPDNAEVPSLDIKAVLAGSIGSIVVSLGVPLWMSGRANAFRPGQEPDPRVKLLYRLREMECADENTGDNPKPLQVRMINARLMLEREDSSDMEVLPLLRIQRSVDREQDMPRQDARFVPPCLVLRGSPTLRRIATELAAKVESSRDDLAQKLARGGLGAEARLEMLLRLRTLGHFAGSLTPLAEAAATTPFEFCLRLRELHGELAAFLPSLDEFKHLPYAHDNPLPCFEDLDARIRRLLVDKKGNVIQLKFQENPKGHPQATFADEHFTRPTAYYLGIKTQADRTALAGYVKDGNKFKFMPASLEGSAIFGVELKEENFPPQELPAEAGLYYFKASLKESRRWATFQSDKSVVLEWKKSEFDLTGATFSLYLTLPV